MPGNVRTHILQFLPEPCHRYVQLFPVFSYRTSRYIISLFLQHIRKVLV